MPPCRPRAGQPRRPQGVSQRDAARPRHRHPPSRHRPGAVAGRSVAKLAPGGPPSGPVAPMPSWRSGRPLERRSPRDPPPWRPGWRERAKRSAGGLRGDLHRDQVPRTGPQLSGWRRRWRDSTRVTAGSSPTGEETSSWRDSPATPHPVLELPDQPTGSRTRASGGPLGWNPPGVGRGGIQPRIHPGFGGHRAPWRGVSHLLDSSDEWRGGRPARTRVRA